jgi:hypothetical protein
MSSPAVETTAKHPAATRRELRQERRERRLVATVAVAVLAALLTVAALVIDHQHHRSPVTGPPGTIELPVAARAG